MCYCFTVQSFITNTLWYASYTSNSSSSYKCDSIQCILPNKISINILTEVADKNKQQICQAKIFPAVHLPCLLASGYNGNIQQLTTFIRTKKISVNTYKWQNFTVVHTYNNFLYMTITSDRYNR